MTPQESPYRISYHQVARVRLQACWHQLSLAGWNLHALTEKLRQMEVGLKHDPLGHAEAIYRLAQVELIIAIAFARPLVFHVGIHEPSRTVFIRNVALMTLDET